MSTRDMVSELRAEVAREISPIAKPREIHVVPELPKTRSGKIMRRLLRDVAEGRELVTPQRFSTRRCSRRFAPVRRISRSGLKAGPGGAPVVGTKPDPGRSLLVTSASTAFIETVTAGVQGDVFHHAGGQSVGECSVEHSDEFVVHGDRRTGVAGSTAHLVDDGPGLSPGPHVTPHE